MRVLLMILLAFSAFSCQDENKKKAVIKDFKSVDIGVIYEDSVSIRTLEILDDGSLAFAGSNGKYGLYDPVSQKWATNTIVGFVTFFTKYRF